MSKMCLCIAACFALCGLGRLAAPGQVLATPAGAPVPAQAQRAVQKWEYKTVNRREMVDYAAVNNGGKSAKEQFADSLAKLGDEGWEMVTVDSGSAFYFKRPK
jgi:hypothetical protein